MPKNSVERLSAAQARRMTLAAQGFAIRRPAAPSIRHLHKVFDRLGAVQIDSVNVLARAHYMPLFSRLGPYDRRLLDQATGGAMPRFVECWAHEASLVDPQTYRQLRWRMVRWRERASHRDRWAAEQAGLLDDVTSVIKAAGPVTAVEIERHLASERQRIKRDWWDNWSPVKQVVEYLFLVGEVCCAGRTAQFERRYATPETVLPAEVLAAGDPSDTEAFATLVELASRAYGVATERDLGDYFRLKRPETRAAVDLLVERGDLLPVQVEGVRAPAWVHREARLPGRVQARALLSPFDPLIWERNRMLELFGVRYRIEIYVPAAKRQYGYYVLPFLLGDRIVARVDLKADRKAGLLLVKAAYAEPGAPADTAEQLAAELESMAGWLDLAGVSVSRQGDLAPALAGALG